MKKYLFIAIAALSLAACKQPDIPQPVGGNADFTYTEISPLYIQFTNKSTSGLSADFWDFGDKKYASGSETITHKYAQAGTYKVVLTCKDKYSYMYTKEKLITVKGEAAKTYSKAYIKGFKITAIPNSGYYYMLEAHDNLLEEIGHTETVAIKTANLPKTLNLTTRVNVNSVYVVSMWKSTSKSAMPSPIFDYEKTPKFDDLKNSDYPEEVALYNENGTAVNVIFEYEE